MSLLAVLGLGAGALLNLWGTFLPQKWQDALGVKQKPQQPPQTPPAQTSEQATQAAQAAQAKELPTTPAGAGSAAQVATGVQSTQPTVGQPSAAQLPPAVGQAVGNVIGQELPDYAPWWNSLPDGEKLQWIDTLLATPAERLAPRLRPIAEAAGFGLQR